MADEVADQLANLNLKEVDEATAEKIFEKIKNLKQVKDVTVLNTDGKCLHSTLELPEGELKYVITQKQKNYIRS